jgi:hypothetical protein
VRHGDEWMPARDRLHILERNADPNQPDIFSAQVCLLRSRKLAWPLIDWWIRSEASSTVGRWCNVDTTSTYLCCAIL